MSPLKRHRTVWLSDVHLGSRACRAEFLLEFLAQTRTDVLYLVGDIVDLHALRRSFYWPKAHTLVLERLLRMTREGTRIFYVPGNHDDDFRAFDGAKIGGIEVRRRMIHETSDGPILALGSGR